MERYNSTLSATERIKEQFKLFPQEGLLLHGTSSHRSEGIKREGFASWEAQGDRLDEFSNHFFYYNPNPDLVTSSTFWVLRREIGLLLHYSQWATRNDLFDGENYPTIILLKKPENINIDPDDQETAKKIPIMVSTHDTVPPDTIIDTLELRDMPLYNAETRKQQGETIIKIWQSLKANCSSEPQSPARE